MKALELQSKGDKLRARLQALIRLNDLGKEFTNKIDELRLCDKQMISKAHEEGLSLNKFGRILS
tara:strand:+ start:7649 stop:7840 length:192 start_codon:yes stop_codon:yes gene_type:complete